MIVEISWKEYVESLYQLKSELSVINGDIEKAGAKLKMIVNSYGNALGPYQEDINDLVDNVNIDLVSCKDFIEFINQLAGKIQGILSMGFDNQI